MAWHPFRGGIGHVRIAPPKYNSHFISLYLSLLLLITQTAVIHPKLAQSPPQPDPNSTNTTFNSLIRETNV